MYCGNCGAPVKEKSLYCTACGNKLDQSDQSEQRNAHSVKKKPMPFWFKLAAGIAFLALVGVAGGIWFTENLRATVENQLESLKEGDISKAYYAYTSKDFQQATPLDVFKEYVQTYPILKAVKSTKFDQRTVKNNIGVLKGFLISEDGMEFPIEYELTKDSGKWKIQNIHLLAGAPELTSSSTDVAVDKNDIVANIHSQIDLIRKNELDNAYRLTTSSEFQSLTSLEDFKEFVKAYPLLSSDAAPEVAHPSVLDNFASVVVTINKDGKTLTLDYNMIFEQGQWKIWGVKGEVSK